MSAKQSSASTDKATISEKSPADTQERNFGTNDNPMTRAEMKSPPKSGVAGSTEGNQSEKPPAPFAEYGQLGILGYNFINKQIHKQTQPVMWNVHGRSLQVIGVTEAGKLQCQHTGSDETAEVSLDSSAYEKLLGMLI